VLYRTCLRVWRLTLLPLPERRKPILVNFSGDVVSASQFAKPTRLSSASASRC